MNARNRSLHDTTADQGGVEVAEDDELRVARLAAGSSQYAAIKLAEIGNEDSSRCR